MKILSYLDVWLYIYSKYASISGFEFSKRGVLNFTKSWDLEKALENAPPKVRAIFKEKSIAFDGQENVAVNTKAFLNWFHAEFYAAFGKAIGFTRATFEQKLAPGKGKYFIT